MKLCNSNISFWCKYTSIYIKTAIYSKRFVFFNYVLRCHKRIFTNFASPIRIDTLLKEELSGLVLLLLKAFARFVFDHFEPRKFTAQVKAMSEADATGMAYTSPKCAEGVKRPHARLSGIVYSLFVGITLSVTCAGFPRT